MVISPGGFLQKEHRKKRMKIYTLVGFLLAVFLILAVCKVYAAADTSGDNSLSALIAQALRNNPTLRASRAEAQASVEAVSQAAALPDPTVSYAIMGPMLETPLGPQKDVYEFEQMIPFPGKLWEKRNMAMAETLAQKARAQLTERELIQKVSETYYDLFALFSQISVAEEILTTLKNFEGIAQSRYAGQSGTQKEVVQAEIEISNVLADLLVLRQRRDTLLSYLKSLLNAKENLSLTHIAEPDLPQALPSLEEFLAAAKKHRPQLEEARALLDREIHSRRLAKYENSPDFSVGFQYIRIGEGDTSDPDDGRDAWMIPIKVTLPLWQGRNTAVIRESQHRLAAVEARWQQEENNAEYAVREMYYQVTTQKQILELYRNALLAQAELAFRSDQAGYEAGKTDILTLIESEGVYLKTRMAYFQAFADVLKSLALLNQVVGVDLLSEAQATAAHVKSDPMQSLKDEEAR